MSEERKAQWHWQEEGTSWKGVGIYHVTLTLPSRRPLLGTLHTPGNDPTQARVEPTELGQALLLCQRSVPLFHPEIQILQYCLMPDHLHAIWYVRQPMKQSIRYVAQGFWRAAKKAGRAWSYLNTRLTGGTSNKTPSGQTSNGPTPGAPTPSGPTPGGPTPDGPTPSAPTPGGPTSGAPTSGAPTPGAPTSGAPTPSGPTSGAPTSGAPTSDGPSLLSLAPAYSRATPLCDLLGRDAYCQLDPLFTEVPFLRPLTRRGQLKTMFSYVRLNPQRLATKRLYPGFFRVQQDIAISGRTYAAVGNVALLQARSFAPVHVRHTLTDAAARGNSEPLRNYMNGCVLAARQGVVMVSPFISPKEKAVKQVLLNEHHCFIVLADNGFRDYYKPSGELFDAVAAGRVLILSPWPYDSNKRHISRADCVALNTMAEEIASMD